MFFIATCGADATNTTTNNDYISRKIKHIKTLLRESVKKDTQKEIFIKVTGSDTKYTFLLKQPLLKHIFKEMKMMLKTQSIQSKHMTIQLHL